MSLEWNCFISPLICAFACRHTRAIFFFSFLCLCHLVSIQEPFSTQLSRVFWEIILISQWIDLLLCFKINWQIDKHEIEARYLYIFTIIQWKCKHITFTLHTVTISAAFLSSVILWFIYLRVCGGAKVHFTAWPRSAPCDVCNPNYIWPPVYYWVKNNVQCI